MIDPDDHSLPNPLAGRQRRLILALRIGMGLAGVLAAIGVLVPGDIGEMAATAFMATLIALPLARVMWLMIRWMYRRDLRFAAVSAGVLFVAVLAAASAW